MAKKVYLVDTENVGSVWVKLLSNVPKQDEIILFYTEHSPAVSYTDLISLLDHTDRFEFVKCYTGRNGLDFQLVSYLGYMLRSASKTEYIIVSNDYGFDSVVKFWCERDRLVSRLTAAKINAEYNRRPSSPEKAIAAPEETAVTAPVPENTEISFVPVSGSAEVFHAENEMLASGGEQIVSVSETETLAADVVSVVPADAAVFSTPEVVLSDKETSAKETVSKNKVRVKTAKRKTETAQDAKSETGAKTNRSAASRRKPARSSAEKIVPSEEDVNSGTSQSEEAKSLLTETLSPVIGTEEIDWAFDMLKKYDIGKDGLNVIYCEIIKHFAQEKGLNVYRRLKPVISKFYSITNISVS